MNPHTHCQEFLIQLPLANIRANIFFTLVLLLGLKSYLGCNGASPEAYPKWVVNKKLLHETTYGYVAAQSTYKCPTDKTYWKPGSKVTSYGMGKHSSF